MRGFMRADCAIGFTSFCKKWKPEILDAHFVWPDGVAIARLARELGIPYVITLRGKLYECLPIASQKKTVWKSTEKCIGRYQCVQSYGTGGHKTRRWERKFDCLFRNGIDREKLFPRDKEGNHGGSWVCPKKSRILVTVFPPGASKRPSWSYSSPFRTAGWCVPGDCRRSRPGGYCWATEKQSPRNLVWQIAWFLPGPQPYEKNPSLFSVPQMPVCWPLTGKDCPNAVLESLACGTPVVASDVGAVRDILPVPDAGRIVPAQQVWTAEAGVGGGFWRWNGIRRMWFRKKWGEVVGWGGWGGAGSDGESDKKQRTEDWVLRTEVRSPTSDYRPLTSDFWPLTSDFWPMVLFGLEKIL